MEKVIVFAISSLNLLRRVLLVSLVAIGCWVTVGFTAPQPAHAYPFWAQQNYASPREATGRIVCANCHLAEKPTYAEVPQAVLPDTVFEAVVKIPYDEGTLQVGGDGSKVPLNVGAVVMLPDGFKIAPPDRIPDEMKEKTSGVYYQSYAPDKENIVIVGPLPGEQYQEIVFPVLSPNPSETKGIHFGKYQIHVGGNRGRGQVYPTGEKSNNAVYTASKAGVISDVTAAENGGYQVAIATEEGGSVVDTVPAGPELIVSKGDTVAAGAPLTNDPNMGGFGQRDVEIVLQNPARIYGLIAFFAIVTLSQILLVLKKKQVEKVQAAEMEF